MAVFNLSHLVQDALERFGWELRRTLPRSNGRLTKSFPELSAGKPAIIEQLQPFTMMSLARLAVVVANVAHVVKHRIPGAIVEYGVWRGGSMTAAALTLCALEYTTQPLFLFDRFEGLPPQRGATSAITAKRPAASS